MQKPLLDAYMIHTILYRLSKTILNSTGKAVYLKMLAWSVSTAVPHAVYMYKTKNLATKILFENLFFSV